MKVIIALLMTMILSFAVAAPATLTDLAPAVSVKIVIDTPGEAIAYGEVIELRCEVNGLAEGYSIQWQYSADLQEWIDIDCYGDVYSYTLMPDNADYYYRVVITYGDNDTDEQPQAEPAFGGHGHVKRQTYGIIPYPF